MACDRQVARVAGSMKPLLASPADNAGFPMTSLFRSMPAAAISNKEDLGQSPPDVFNKPSHVVYSVVPSENAQ